MVKKRTASKAKQRARTYAVRSKKGVRRVGVTTRPTRRGRPVEYPMPEPIDGATPERVAEVVLQAKPKTTWRYMEAARNRRRKAPNSDGPKS